MKPMSKLSPLSKFEHTKLKIVESTDYSRFKEQHVIPIVVQEFSALASEFPLVFINNAVTDVLTPVAMMGIKNGVNLYCQNNEWLSPVTPIGFSNAPLSIVKQSQDSTEVMVYIDEESDLVSHEIGNPLFEDNGNKTDYLVKKSQKLVEIDQYSQQTAAIMHFLASKNLFCNRPLKIKLTNESQQYSINGINIIDEEVLNNLPIQDFEELRTKGLLPLIYAHLNSLHQMARLTLKQNVFDEKNNK